MTPVTEIHLNDVGTILEITLYDNGSVVDISSATTKQFLFRKPDEVVLTKTAVFTTNGTDGKLRYTTQSGDIDTEGYWEFQAYIVTPSGSWSSEVVSFAVLPNI